MQGVRAHRALIAVAVALLLSVTPAGAADSDGDGLEEVEERREAVRRDLAEVEAKLDRAAARVDEAEAKLAEASARLTAVRGDLADAEEALAVATARDQAAARALLEATEEMEALRAEAARAQSLLDRRAVAAYKRGGPELGGALLLEGVATSRDLHDVAVAAHTVEGLLDRDAALLGDARKTAAAALRARNTVHERRAESKARQQEADRRRRHVEELVARQERIVEDMRREREARTEALAAIERDRTATAVLLRRLDERVRSLRFDGARALLTANAEASFDGPMPAWAARLPQSGRRWAPAVVGAAGRAGVDARLMAALVWTESAFVPTAVSSAGALGLAQLMPATASMLGVDPYDPLDNLYGGARYLRRQLEHFGRIDLALAAYNAGPARVAAAGNQVPEIVETQLYVIRVLDRYEHITRE